MAAASLLTTAEGDPRAKVRMLMECHGRLVRAHGPARRAPGFAEFVDQLKKPLAELMPPGVVPGHIGSLKLLNADGTASSDLEHLAFEGPVAWDASHGFDVDREHLRSVVRAASKSHAKQSFARLTPETVQNVLFKAMKHAGEKVYVSCRDVVTAAPVQKVRAIGHLPAPLRALEVYTDIPADRSFCDRFARCPFCQWTMRVHALPGGAARFECDWPDHRDRGAVFRLVRTPSGEALKFDGDLRKPEMLPRLEPVGDYRALSYGLWLWVTIPGRFEMALADALRLLGADVEMWPFGDMYDLHVEKNGRVWRVDAKTWASMYELADEMCEAPPPGRDSYIVIPDKQAQYASLVRRAVKAQGWKVLTGPDLIAAVEAA
ncbi:hypothetical protein GCM10023205_04120 [Yinghuangia aomiensis]|uniref:REase associating with pPIWI RE domain-containing protein n=1 Tax=Yinghuangia aomiensis TaxID=676205 RepID=A0ABP9GQI6_9ACTN